MIKLVRLDYRLLHGQVVFSWTQNIGATRIIIVDDEAANDEFKKTALNLSKPTGVRLNIFTLEKTLEKMPKIEKLEDNIMMIFGNTKTLASFCKNYPKIKTINYGGMANKPGAKQYAAAIFLDAAEQADTKEILGQGISIYMQQTPGHKKENLTDL
ncbi:MAG: PTS sugar transporter subunit IIB [Eubacteriales bacterium]|nr:PTS sugar transporter subunit IIB [Eubacteriales bacterium]